MTRHVVGSDPAIGPGNPWFEALIKEAAIGRTLGRARPGTGVPRHRDLGRLPHGTPGADLHLPGIQGRSPGHPADPLSALPRDDVRSVLRGPRADPEVSVPLPPGRRDLSLVCDRGPTWRHLRDGPDFQLLVHGRNRPQRLLVPRYRKCVRAYLLVLPPGKRLHGVRDPGDGRSRDRRVPVDRAAPPADRAPRDHLRDRPTPLQHPNRDPRSLLLSRNRLDPVQHAGPTGHGHAVRRDLLALSRYADAARRT